MLSIVKKYCCVARKVIKTNRTEITTSANDHRLERMAS